jgi:hypothetical protein
VQRVRGERNFTSERTRVGPSSLCISRQRFLAGHRLEDVAHPYFDFSRARSYIYKHVGTKKASNEFHLGAAARHCTYTCRLYYIEGHFKVAAFTKTDILCNPFINVASIQVLSKSNRQEDTIETLFSMRSNN